MACRTCRAGTWTGAGADRGCGVNRNEDKGGGLNAFPVSEECARGLLLVVSVVPLVPGAWCAAGDTPPPHAHAVCHRAGPSTRGALCEVGSHTEAGFAAVVSRQGAMGVAYVGGRGPG